MKKEILLSDNYLPVEIGGKVEVKTAFFKVRKTENGKILKGLVTLQLSCKIEIDDIKLESQMFEKTFELSNNELDELLPNFVQTAYLEDRVVGVLS